MKNKTLPQPKKDGCNSWIVFDPKTKQYCETFKESTAQYFLDNGMIVKTSYRHLCDLNESLKTV